MSSLVIENPQRKGLKQTFAALRYPNYRLWFFGQIISLMGTWMQNTAQGFLVYELTKSPAFLGYVGFAAGIPAWLLMLWAGLVADRAPRRTMMIITQTIMMILAFVLAGLTFAGIVQPWHIIALAFCLGAANAFDTPARMALTADLVQKEDLTNAIALNGGMFNAATIVGPAVAGITYAAFGPAWCFVINGISFIAVIAGLAWMKIPRQTRAAVRVSARTGLVEGFRYVLAEPAVRTIILIVGVTNLFGTSFSTLMPAWAVSVLGGDVRTNGLLRAAQGAGALAGALTLASLGRSKLRGRLLTLGTFTFPLLLLGFSFIRWIPGAMMELVFVGLSVVMVMNLCNALVQSTVPDALRGRVMSIYSLVMFGLFPIGSLLMGNIAEAASEPAAIRISASIFLASAGLVAFLAPGIRKME